MSSVVEADGENLSGGQGRQEFGDLDFFSGGLKAVEEIAFQLEGCAICLEFRVGDLALGVEMANDFHRSGVR